VQGAKFRVQGLEFQGLEELWVQVEEFRGQGSGLRVAEGSL
jgi:hypothetical protein